MASRNNQKLVLAAVATGACVAGGYYLYKQHAGRAKKARGRRRAGWLRLRH